MKIIIDKEFEQLIPPLSDEEFAGLEKDILENGVRVPLMVCPQPYAVAIRLAQEIAYLYGERDLFEGGELSDESVKGQLVLYIGVMMGSTGAIKTVQLLASNLAAQALKKLPQKALTKTFYYPIIKAICKAFGIAVTKESFAKGVSKVIPIAGGVVSGAITLASMNSYGKTSCQCIGKGKV